MAEKDVKVAREGSELVFTDGAIERRYNIDALPEDMREELMFHGAKQKIRDSYSGYRKKGVKWYEMADDVYNALSNGTWERKPTSKLTKLQELADAGAFSAKLMALLKGLGLIK